MSTALEFRLPDLGEGLEEAEIVTWLVEVGDTVALNQDIVEVETAKAVVTVPSPLAGVVVERAGDAGTVVPVGAVLLRVRSDGPAGVVPADDGTEDELKPLVGYGRAKGAAVRRRRTARAGGAVRPAAPAPVASVAAPDPTDPATVRGASGTEGSPARADAPAGRGRTTPLVRRLARELGVDLTTMSRGSGVGGLITRADVQEAARGGAVAASAAAADGTAPSVPAAVLPAPDATVRPAVPGFRGRTPGEVERIGGIRRRIVERMERSRAEIPSATISRDADLTELVAVRRVLQAQAADLGLDVRITALPLVMRAVVVGLRRFPVLNARIDREGGTIELLEDINLGFAADTERGLLVPNLKRAQDLSVLQLAAGVAELAERARSGRAAPAELVGGTFTVNNYGAFGNDDGDPIINQPEVGILGVGAIRRRPWVVRDADGAERLEIRDVARFTLAFDHRVCDGGEAGRFVTLVADLCERPERLLLF